VGEDRPDRQRVQLVEAPLQRLPELGELGPQAPLGQLGEDLGIGGAGAERVEHRPSRDREDVGREAVELDVGVRERVVQAVGLALALGDLGFAIARELGQLADRLGRHEVCLEQPGLDQLAQPRRVGEVGPAPPGPA